MSITRDKLEMYLNDLLEVEEYDDLGPNGLQVEGQSEVNKIVTGVSGCVELFQKAIEEEADTIIVHHGIVWEFERPVYKGGYKERVKLLLENNMNLFGFHLPIDAHSKLGNNAVLANILGLKEREPFGSFKGNKIGIKGLLDNTAEEVFEKIKDEINSDAIIFPFGPDIIKKAGIVSGGAEKNIKDAVNQNLDLFVTGEVSEHIMHYAREEGIHFVAAGHHATERFGVQAIGEHLKNKFDVEVKFINIPNPA
ncbi:MAG: Nif3-like dinuclear metal center hexameric protein [Candidatus Marinimicrobia bacterium]|nr:Nif3-like dinuclear metal center hexameric protein [Candidatus Neomarinimicrobiota bacterium]